MTAIPKTFPQTAISRILETAEVYEPEKPKKHPLDNIINLDFKPKPPEWLLDGIVQVGVVTLAGTRGVGKTTSLLPLAAAVAHLCPEDYPLRPKLRRHVIWISEDVGQAERVLAALIKHGGWSTKEEVREWFHVIPAVRLEPDVVAEAAPMFAERFTVEHRGTTGVIKAKPLVVFDTSNACFDLENESDNSQVGKFMASIKTAFDGFPVLIIGHVAKAMNQTDDARELTSRGAGAWEGDAHQCLYLVETKNGIEPGERQLRLGKKRFETDVEALRFESHVCEETVLTSMGEETIRLRYSLAQPLAFGEMAKAKQERTEEAKLQQTRELRQQALELVTKYRKEGNPIGKSRLRAVMSGKNATCGEIIEKMILEQWLVEVPVPPKLRSNPAKSAFLIALTDEERRVYQANAALPRQKAEIPASWLKAEAKTA